jgi:2-oxoglutarate dehydrogenase E2 component (dihydrolipoamide succinyltransferase)
MPINIVVPEVGESVVDARVARWLKQPGDSVASGEAIVELETDKVDVEVSAPAAGVLSTIAHADGADVKIGEVLGTMEVGAAKPAADKAPASRQLTRRPRAGSGEICDAAPPAPAAAEAAAPPALAPESSRATPLTSPPSSDAPLSPSARRRAREQEQAAAPAAAQAKAAAPAPASAPATTAVPAPAPSADPAGTNRQETRQRMSRRRATIAKRLLEAQQTAALLTTFNEIDMTAVQAIRAKQREAFQKRHGASLGITSFFVKAAVAALKDFPKLNAEIQGDVIVMKHYYDIGVAIGGAEGLVVPVVRDADRLSFEEVELGIRDLAARSADGKLTLDDLRGGTFSITNGGRYGSLMSTPIVNPPQVGILGLHAIKDRPIVVDGQVQVRPMMFAALTYDHRIVDGEDAVRFLVKIRDLIEDPGALLLSM